MTNRNENKKKSHISVCMGLLALACYVGGDETGIQPGEIVLMQHFRLFTGTGQSLNVVMC